MANASCLSPSVTKQMEAMWLSEGTYEGAEIDGWESVSKSRPTLPCGDEVTAVTASPRLSLIRAYDFLFAFLPSPNHLPGKVYVNNFL